MQQPLEPRQKISLVKKTRPKPWIYFLLFLHSLTRPRQLSPLLLPISTLAATAAATAVDKLHPRHALLRRPPQRLHPPPSTSPMHLSRLIQLVYAPT